MNSKVYLQNFLQLLRENEHLSFKGLVSRVTREKKEKKEMKKVLEYYLEVVQRRKNEKVPLDTNWTLFYVLSLNYCSPEFQQKVLKEICFEY